MLLTEKLVAMPLTLLLLRVSKVLVSMFMIAAAFLSLAASKAAAVVVRLNVFEIYSLRILPMFMFDRIFFDILPIALFESA